MIKLLIAIFLIAAICYGLYQISLKYTGLQIFTTTFILVSLLGISSFYVYLKRVDQYGE